MKNILIFISNIMLIINLLLLLINNLYINLTNYYSITLSYIYIHNQIHYPINNYIIQYKQTNLLKPHLSSPT